MHRKKIRRSFLLVEILTASFVAGIVIAACLSVLVLFTLVRTKEDLIYRSAQKKLQETISLRSILSFIEISPGENKFFVEDGPSGQKKLTFHMNAGYNIIPGRSGDSKASIYVDQEKGLVFVQKPILRKKDKTSIKEDEDLFKDEACIIWPGVKSVCWSFFAEPKADNVFDNTPEGEKGGWKDVWEDKEPPLAIRALVRDSKTSEPVEVTSLILCQLHKVKIQGN